MGLGANEDGHCSSCDVSHLRPWGSNCLAYKEALVKCSDLMVDSSEYQLYLDLNLLKYAKDLPENVSGSSEDAKLTLPDQVQMLTDINLQQKKQIQSLLHQLADKKKTAPSIPPPPLIDQGQVLQQIVQRLDRLEKNQQGGLPPQLSTPRSGLPYTTASQGQVLTASGAVSTANLPATPGQLPHSAAVTAMGQMADAMEHLSLSIDPSSGRKPGQLLRPEFHCCILEKGMPIKNADAINEYLYGMCLVMQHLVETKGDWMSYFNHYRRVMKFFIGKRYVNAAYIGYDKEVIDCFLKNPSGGFNSSDSLAIPTHFCSANAHEVQNSRSKGQRRQKQSEYRSRTTSANQSQPDDWPEEACYQYNMATCNGSCGKQHVCGRCLIRGHRVNSCRVKLGEKN